MWGKLDSFGRVPLVQEPTPLHPLKRLSAELGIRLWIKRDDCTGLALGGNKARKLEYLLHEAVNSGARHIVTSGALQSNHARMTAAASAMLGIECHLVLDCPAGVDPEIYGQNGNRALFDLFGANVSIVPTGHAQTRAQELASELGDTAYLVPKGAASALGALGYVRAARELTEQAKVANASFTTLIVGTGTASMQGGLVAGLVEAEASTRLLGFAVDHNPDKAAEVLGFAQGAAQLAGLNNLAGDEHIAVDTSQVGPGYAQLTPQANAAVELCARLEGILLDPIYTGKAMAGLIALAKAGRFSKHEDILFLHSGGAPALFVFPELQPAPDAAPLSRSLIFP